MDVTVNGSARQVGGEADATAVQLLRDTLGLTGTKLVCGAGCAGRARSWWTVSPRSAA